MTHIIRWMNLEDIMLSETSQPKKGQLLYDSFYHEVLRVVKFIKTEGEWWLPGEEGNQE